VIVFKFLVIRWRPLVNSDINRYLLSIEQDYEVSMLNYSTLSFNIELFWRCSAW